MPLDREVGDSETEPLREKEDFDVKGKTINLLPGEDCLGSGASKGFESALRIVNTSHRELANDGIERLAHVTAKPALLPGDSALFVLAIAEQHVRFWVRVEVFDERIHSAQRNTEVSIHVEDEITARRLHPGAHCEAFAAMLLIRNDAQIRLAGRRLAGYLARPV